MKAIYLGYSLILSQHAVPPVHIARPLSELLHMDLDEQPDSGFAAMTAAGVLDQPLVAELRKTANQFLPGVDICPSVYPAILLVADGKMNWALLWLAVLLALWDIEPRRIDLDRLFERFPEGLPLTSTYDRLWAAQKVGDYNTLVQEKSWK